MQQFKFSEAGFSKYIKRFRSIMIIGVVILLGLYTMVTIFVYNVKDITTTLYTILIIGIIYGIGIFRGLKRQKKTLLSYSVTFSPEGITREQYNAPPLFISFMEIKEIIKSKKGGFIIKGKDRTEIILIPRFIDNPEALEKALAELAPITYNKKYPIYRRLAVLLVPITLAMMICVYAVDNKVVVAICGPLVVGLLAWAFYEFQRNKNLPSNARRIRWFLLIVILSMIYATYAKLTDTWSPY